MHQVSHGDDSLTSTVPIDEAIGKIRLSNLSLEWLPFVRLVKAQGIQYIPL